MASRSIELLAFNDDILAEILIRLPSLSELGRACTVCSVFRRVITGHFFLRRMYLIHPPSLLGFRTFTGRFQPVEPPHPSTALAGALAGASDFRFSFIPDWGFWVVRDARAGRFVLDYAENEDAIFTKIAVCDPLFKRYVILPPIPQELPSDILHARNVEGFHTRKYHVFLAPGGIEGQASKVGAPERFRIIWMVLCPSKIIMFVFSSVTWEWQAIASPSRLDQDPKMSVSMGPRLLWRSYAYGSFYWLLGTDKLFVLETSMMELSYVSPLLFAHRSELAIVELGGSKCGMFLFDYSTDNVVLRFYSADMQNRGDGNTEWFLENEVSLSRSYEYKYRILGDADGKLILQRQSFISEPEFSCISLDFKTLHIQMVRGMLRGGYSVPFLYIGYPPSLSLPTI